MKTIRTTLLLAAVLGAYALMAWASTAFGDDPGSTITVSGFSNLEAKTAQEIDIVGPTKAESGDELTFRLQGTPSVDLSKPLVEQLDWLMGPQRMYVWLAMPGQPIVPLDVEARIVFSVDGATLRPEVRFTAGDNGEYRVLVDWNQGQPQLAEAIVKVGGEVPPVPPPVPVPSGLPLVLILSESLNRTPVEVEVETALRRHLESLPSPQPTFRLLDPSQTPTWASKIRQQISQGNLSPPVLAAIVLSPEFSSSTGDGASCVGAETLPDDADAAIAFVKEALKL